MRRWSVEDLADGTRVVVELARPWIASAALIFASVVGSVAAVVMCAALVHAQVPGIDALPDARHSGVDLVLLGVANVLALEAIVALLFWRAVARQTFTIEGGHIWLDTGRGARPTRSTRPRLACVDLSGLHVSHGLTGVSIVARQRGVEIRLIRGLEMADAQCLRDELLRRHPWLLSGEGAPISTWLGSGIPPEDRGPEWQVKASGSSVRAHLASKSQLAVVVGGGLGGVLGAVSGEFLRDFWPAALRLVVIFAVALCSAWLLELLVPSRRGVTIRLRPEDLLVMRTIGPFPITRRRIMVGDVVSVALSGEPDAQRRELIIVERSARGEMLHTWRIVIAPAESAAFLRSLARRAPWLADRIAWSEQQAPVRAA